MEAAIVRRSGGAILARVLAAGAIWGLTVAAGLCALNTLQCGLPCPADIAFTTILSVAVGMVTIGPVVAFHSRF